MTALFVLLLGCLKLIENGWFAATKNKSENVQGWVVHPISSVAIMGIVFVGLLSAIPSVMPVYTLSNGQQTIVYQGMVHVGQVSYYQQIDRDIRDKREQGFTVYREGVGASGVITESDPECDINKPSNLFNGIKQPNCLGGYMAGDIFADMTREQFMAAMARVAMMDGMSKEEAEISADKEMVSLQKLSKRRSDSLRYYMTKPLFMAMSLGMLFNDGILDKGKSTPSDRVILDERNQILANAINDNENDKHYVFYGLGHFEGTLALLQEQDPSWEIVDTRFVRSF